MKDEKDVFDDDDFDPGQNFDACVYAPPPDIIKNDENNSIPRTKRKVAPIIYDDEIDPGFNHNECVYGPPPVDDEDSFDPADNIAPDVYGPPPDMPSYKKPRPEKPMSEFDAYIAAQNEKYRKRIMRKERIKNWFRRKWLKK